jgi:hypothetical protein
VSRQLKPGDSGVGGREGGVLGGGCSGVGGGEGGRVDRGPQSAQSVPNVHSLK